MSAMDYERVARFYDSYVQTDMDVPFFLREAKKAGGPVLELTAGTGRVSIPLLLAGTDLTCVDSSPAMLALSSVENYGPVSKSVNGSQFYDVRCWDGSLLAGMTVNLRFCLHSHYDFQSLAEAAGFVPVHLYGDYSYGPFEPETSPFMIWVLRKARAETV
jgi:hypothetical protein